MLDHATITAPFEGAPAGALLACVARLEPAIRGAAHEAEALGRLHDDTHRAIHDTGLYRMLLPVTEGGAGLDLAAALPIIEAMASVDGAAGWNVGVGAIGLLLAASLLPAPGRAALLDDPGAHVAGGLSPGTVRATATDVGMAVAGRVPFASGVHHATWVLVGGMAWDDGPVLDAAGAPVFAAGLVRPDQVEILDTWHVTGLRATGSADVDVNHVFVPDALSFTFSGELPLGARGESLPVTAALGPGLAAVALGIADHAVALASDLVSQRTGFGSAVLLSERPDVQADLARARGLLAGARALLHDAWDRTTDASPATLADLRLACITVVSHATAATDLAFDTAGSSALFESHDLERCWRDAHAVTKHTMVSTRHLPRLGAIGLGLPAGPGFI